jgi:hypothetical protein
MASNSASSVQLPADKSPNKATLTLLVQFSKRKSLLALIEVEQTLSTAMDSTVDLVTEHALSPTCATPFCKKLRFCIKQNGIVYLKHILDVNRLSNPSTPAILQQR